MSPPIGRPIKPSEIGDATKAVIPPFVFDAFNALIALHWNCGCAEFKLSEARKEVKDRSPEKSDDFPSGWLNVEEAYRADGWKVTFDRPGYNESYPATFTFSVKKT